MTRIEYWYGSYGYVVIPFGLTNAPSNFQMTMSQIFCSLLDKCVIVYLDDILIYSETQEQHLKNLEAYFTLLQEHRLLMKKSKSEFLKDSLEFLGHVISTKGVKVDPRKIEIVQGWLPPKNLQELQRFLGFVKYVRRFIPNMAVVTAPLPDLLRKGTEYRWGEKEQVAFFALKTFLCSTPVFRIANPHHPFEVIMEASDIAIGVVLLQDFDEGLQPIAYESRKLHPPERNYPIHDKEMLAIVHAFKVWQCYLTGADMIVWTDHRRL
ncbi:hypothetical protein CLOM_g2964 [Closterium sp. NIES-68]|nr:hypothetical protein CLOM_g2964 [Closterium sp. NIES-68]